MFIHPGSLLNTYKYSEHYAESANRKINKTSVLSSRVHIWREGAAEAFGRSVIAPTDWEGKSQITKSNRKLLGKGVVWTRENNPAEARTWQRYGESSVRRSFSESREEGAVQVHRGLYTKKSSNRTAM